jgi:hypothetical protein
MSEKFDTTQYLQNLEKRPNYPPRYYLPVNARVAWFRSENPHGAIITTPKTIGEVFYVRAQIIVDGEIRATGIAGVRSGKGTTWDGRELEKSETAAIGRALAHVGYGTLYALQDDDETALADAPVGTQPPTPPQTKAGGKPAADGEKRDMVATVVEIKADKNQRPYLLYISGDGTKASGRGRDTLKQVGYDTDKWEVKAGAKYALHPPALVQIERSGNYWNVIENSASQFEQDLKPTGTGDIPF